MSPRPSTDDLERRAAREFWRQLGEWERGALADQLALGCLDHERWFGQHETPDFIRELDALRIDWEEGTP